MGASDRRRTLSRPPVGRTHPFIGLRPRSHPMTTEPASPRIIGQRLAEARNTRGITQEVAADHIGVSRPTFIAIEKGERAAKPVEIVKLAELYGQPVHHFVRTAQPVTDFQP